MKKSVIVCGMLCLLLIAGCGKTNKESIENDFDNVTVVATNTEDTDKKDYSVPEHVSYDVVANSTKSSVHIDADVFANGFANSSVYKVTVVDVDEEYIKQLAARIFDNGEYTTELPYWLMTKSQLDEAIDSRNVSKYSPELDENGCQLANYVGYYALNVESVVDESQSIEAVEGQIFYSYSTSYKQKQFDSANGIYREVGDLIYDTMEYARLSGKINGIPCELMVRKSGEYGESRIWIVADEMHTAGGTEYELDSAMKSENLCDYDSALKQADAMVKRITNSEYSLCKTTARSVNTNAAGRGMVTNGYKFYYTPVVNDYPIVYNSSYTIMAGTEEYVDQPMLLIEIDDKGFVNAKYLTDITVDGCMSDAPALLSFEQSEEEMKLQLSAYLEQKSGVELDIDKVQFSHVVLRQDNRYAIVPFWMYYISNSGYQGVKESAVFGVNALDGSVVVFGTLIDDYYSMLGDM